MCILKLSYLTFAANLHNNRVHAFDVKSLRYAIDFSRRALYNDRGDKSPHK